MEILDWKGRVLGLGEEKGKKKGLESSGNEERGENHIFVLTWDRTVVAIEGVDRHSFQKNSRILGSLSGGNDGHFWGIFDLRWF